MTVYTVTIGNWNDPAFWASVNEAGVGNPPHSIDFHILTGTYSVDTTSTPGAVIISDGTTSFTVGDSTFGGPADATLGGSTRFSFFEDIMGTQGSDDLTGGIGDDILDGREGSDIIDGGAGDDTLLAGYGDDTFIGGAGDDVLQIDGTDVENFAFDIDLGTGTDMYGNVYSGIEAINSGAGNDTITGNIGGGDTISGGGGNDALSAGRFLPNGTVVNDGGNVSGTTGADTFIWQTDAPGSTIINLAPSGGLNNGDNTGDEVYVADTDGGSALMLTRFDVGVDDLVLPEAPASTVLYGSSSGLIDFGVTYGNGNTQQFVIFHDGGTISDPTQFFSVNPYTGSELSGDAGNDTILGGMGDDTLTGGDGNDLIDGGSGSDNIDGGGGQDEIFLSAGNDTIDGGSNATFQSDSINFSNATVGISVTWSDSETGSIVMGADTTTFSGIEFIETWELTGGGGTDDLFDASASTGGIFIQDYLGGADTVIGSGFVDTISLYGWRGELVNSQIDAGAGDDYVYAETGDATILGGAGNDDLSLGDAQSEGLLDGGDGDDILYADGDNVTIFGGSGDDDIFTGAGAQTISGGTGADTIDGNNDADTFLFEDGFGADVVAGGEGGDDTDVLDFSSITTNIEGRMTASERGYFETGSDRVDFSEIERIILGQGNDQQAFGANSNVGLWVDGQGGDDTLIGSSFDDFYLGGDGNDWLIGNSGNDTMSGGDGDDLIDGGAGDDFLTTGLGQDTLLGGAGNDTLMNSDGDDSLDGGAGDDSIVATGGEDTLRGGTGADTMEGGDDADTFIIEDSFGNDVITGGEGTTDPGDTDYDTIDLSALSGPVTVTYTGDEAGTITDGTDTITFSEIERIILTDQNDSVDASADAVGVDIDGGFGDDSILGGSGNDTITGHGHDTVDGGAGDDSIANTSSSNASLSGGSGNDTIQSHNASDVLDGGDGNDLIVDTGASGSRDTIAGGAGDDTISAGDGHDSVEGGEGADQIDGGAGDDSIEGNDGGSGADGADTIDGGAGNDTISGDLGDDVIFGGTGNDAIEGAEGADSIDGGDGDDYLAGFDVGGLAGNAASGDADPNRGGDDGSNDTLLGGTGNDTLLGGQGHDSLTGGDGDDVFGYQSGDGFDTITDFNAGNSGTLDDGDSTNNDYINLSGYYDHISELYADQADDGMLNQSNTTDSRGNAVDYSDNTAFAFGDGITFTGASADSSSFTEENTGVVCFTSGTAIRTPRGDVLIDDLRIGDLVSTADNGPQPIRWIGRRVVDQQALSAAPNLRPVLIKRGVLGNARPLLVSPQHCMLVGHDHLMRAKHLAQKMPGVRIAHGQRRVCYIHLMFDAHQIIFAESSPSESFYPGPMSLKMMSARDKTDLMQTFPALHARVIDHDGIVAGHDQTARTVARRREVAGLVKSMKGRQNVHALAALIA